MENRTCNRCNQEKLITEFGWKIKAKGQRQLMCKECSAAYGRWYREQRRELLGEEAIKAERADLYKKNRMAQLDYHREYYKQNRSRLKKKSREYYRDNRETLLKKSRDYALRSQFGLTAEDYDRMVEEQGGRCAICGKNGRLFVDHCHKTGAVRGLLCPPCNSFLGRIDDSIETLERIAEYLNIPHKS